MPTEQRKKKRINRKVLFPACAIVAVVAGIQPAFAGATADLLYSIIGIIISAISGVIIGILEIILNVLLFIMGTSVNDLKTFGLLAGFQAHSIKGMDIDSGRSFRSSSSKKAPPVKATKNSCDNPIDAETLAFLDSMEIGIEN